MRMTGFGMVLVALVVGQVQAVENYTYAAVNAHLIQGGLLVGRVEPGLRVRFDGQPVPVNAQGLFVVGFGREQPMEAKLDICKGTACSTQTVLVEPRTYKKQVIKGVPQKTVTPNPAQDKQIAREAAAIKASRTGTSALGGFAGSWQWPVKGPISGVYGSSRTYNGVERNWHRGLDIARPTGTPVNAPASGKVVFAAMTFLNGNLIVLDHGQQLFTVYAHLNRIGVKVGDEVKQGGQIGEIGTTGRSTGPHLHWGLFWGQEALDPGLLVGVAPEAQ